MWMLEKESSQVCLQSFQFSNKKGGVTINRNRKGQRGSSLRERPGIKLDVLNLGCLLKKLSGLMDMQVQI